MQGGNVRGVKFYKRYNFLQILSSAQVDTSIETIALMLTATANKETEQQTEAIDCSLVVSSVQICLTENFNGEANVFFYLSLYLSLVTVTSILNTKSEVKRMPCACAWCPITP